jgi:hypothetical protein
MLWRSRWQRQTALCQLHSLSGYRKYYLKSLRRACKILQAIQTGTARNCKSGLCVARQSCVRSGQQQVYKSDSSSQKVSHDPLDVYNIEHKGDMSLLRAPKRAMLLHYYCITSCLLTHCLFGRFFLASFPLYSGGNKVKRGYGGKRAICVLLKEGNI